MSISIDVSAANGECVNVIKFAVLGINVILCKDKKKKGVSRFSGALLHLFFFRLSVYLEFR